MYIKQGRGTLVEVKNSLEGTEFDCILQWTKPDKRVDRIFLNNQRLEALLEDGIGELLDEKSILLKDPDDSTILKTPPAELKVKSKK